MFNVCHSYQSFRLIKQGTKVAELVESDSDSDEEAPVCHLRFGKLARQATEADLRALEVHNV